MNDQSSEIRQDITLENNICLLRLLLALCAFSVHYAVITGIEQIPYPFRHMDIVYAFFAISGMLIYRSYLRTPSVLAFFKRRALRLFPAYLLLVFLSPFLFAPYTSYSLSDYFSSPDLWEYWLANVTTLNFVHPDLPGVLDGAPLNPSLWTIKLEILMYLFVPLLSFVYGREKRRWLSVLAFIVVSVAAVFFTWRADETGVASYDLVGKWLAVTSCFLSGATAYMYRDYLERLKWYLLILAILLMQMDGLMALFIRPFVAPVFVYVAAFATPYFRPFTKVGDLSYGTYIYHDPLIYLSICWGCEASWRAFSLFALALLALSFASWHLLEKKMMSKKL